MDGDNATGPVAVTQAVELLPCPNPWCSSHGDDAAPEREDVWQHPALSPRYRVQCPYCPVKGPTADSEHGAIAAWNTRHRLASLSEPSPQPVAGGSVRAQELYRLWTRACQRHTALLRERQVTDPVVKRSGQRCASLYSDLSTAAIEALAAAPTPAASAPQPASGGVREDTSTAIAAGEVERLRKVLADATSVPWRMEHGAISAHIHQVDGLHWLASCVIGHDDWHSPTRSRGVKDAALIVAAVNALPALLDAVAAAPKAANEASATHAPGSGEVERALERAVAQGERCGNSAIRIILPVHLLAPIRAALSATPPQTGDDPWDMNVMAPVEIPPQTSDLAQHRFANDGAAKALYDSWSDQPGWVPWVERGNSDMQERARREVLL